MTCLGLHTSRFAGSASRTVSWGTPPSVRGADPTRIVQGCLVVLFGLFFLGTAIAAPEPSRPANLGDALFPPEFIMQHADELGLDDAQKEAMRSEFEKLREKFPQMQENLQKQVAALSELMGQESVDSKKAIAQLDKVLDAEREIKRTHLTLVLA